MGKVLIHSIAFNPDGVSTGYLYSDIATALRDAGHEVVVLTTTPHFNRVEAQLKKQPLKWKLWGLLKKSNYKGITVYHVPQKKFKSTALRLVGFVYWHIVSFFSALFIKNVDVILSPSPPLTIGLINLWLGKLKGAKVIYNVQEVYPDILGKDSGMVFSALSKMERHIYNNSAAITTIDEIFYSTIVGRFTDPSKLHIIPNFVDTEIYRPISDTSHLDKSLFIENDRLKLLYAGNIGMAQEWETLIEVAKRTKGKPIDYYVIGEGVMHDYVTAKIKEFDLANVHLLPYQPRELMPEIIAFSDIQYIFMEPKIAAQGFPSKVYTIMASAKPLLVCSPDNTPIVNFLKDIDCAKIITAADVKSKADEICLWLDSVTPEQLHNMGRKGLAEIENKYSKDIVTKQYCKLIRQLQ
ncbi:MAG: glycosyltransferase family 4 protein [Bacteroides sp.]|nr:glycosyltransferase family 4 protein [Bacteroides sp.]MCM1476284.1 glycosyltransferase family 4 protein [Bacteroides sp.]